MALQVWLPLNGTLENKGLSNVTVTGQGTVAYDNNGKIGKCFISGGTSLNTNGISLNNNFLSIFNTTKGCSVAAWIKPVGTHVHYNGTIISSGNWNGSCWAFGVSLDNTKVDVFSRNYNRWIDCSIPVNQWTHLACVFLNGTSKVYKNGEYVGELGGFDNFISDASNTCIGRETYANGYFGFNGRINDVRIYDHCLSPKEVKEISKGLILHYKLDGNDIGITIPRNGDLIPDGVELYDYILNTSDGATIPTGIIVNLNTKVESKWQLSTAGSYSLYSTAISNQDFTAYGGASGLNWRVGGIALDPLVSYDPTLVNTIIQNYLNVTINGTVKGTYSGTMTFHNIELAIFFKEGNSGYPAAHGKLYYFKIWNGSTLVRNFLPCTYLGEPGMWDTVENKFYRNQGTGLFTLGSKIILKEYEYLLTTSAGPYIDTLYKPTVNTRIQIKAIITGGGQFPALISAGTLLTNPWLIDQILIYNNYIDCFGLTCTGYNRGDLLNIEIDNNVMINGINWGQSIRHNIDYSFYIFNTHRNVVRDEFKVIGKIYYCKLYNNNQLARDFVPCTYNGTPGLWDKVEWKFYANAGSGSFTLGPEKTVQQDAPIFYDSSGYCNHGSITGTLTTNSDSPRYTKSTVFSSNTNYITVENVPTKQNCSISFWFNPNSVSNNLIITGHDGVHYVSAMNGSKIYNNGSGQSSKLYIDGVEASSSISGTAIYFNKPLQSGWHHYCFTNVDLSSWTTFKLGGYGSSWPINGKLSDVRLYATALSEDDIKELYNTSAFVTNNGVFAEYELYEDNLSDVKKTGLLETANFYENGAESGYALDTDKTRVASNYIISEDFIEI